MSNPGLHGSVRPSPIFLALIGVTAAGGVLAWLAGASVRPLSYAGVFIFVVAGWLVSLCLHEFGHAYTAWRFGDHDTAVRGYLSLDPRRYSNPWLSLGLPILFIALGGIGLPGAAVYVQTWFMSKRQRTLVSVAGPAANLLLAVFLLVLIQLFGEVRHWILWSGVAFLAFLQIMAVVLNMLPIPGLDGYDALEPHLSPETQRALTPAKQFGGFILLFFVLMPGLNQYLFQFVGWLFEFSGISSDWAIRGEMLTRFWSQWF